MDLFWILVSVGTVIGILIGLYLGINNHLAADVYSKRIFGMKYDDVVFYLVALCAMPVLITMITLSIIVRDLRYPESKPFNFTLEVFIVGIMPAIGILAMPILRGYEFTSKTGVEFALAVVRFAVVHILLQFSGFWSDLFPPLEEIKTE